MEIGAGFSVGRIAYNHDMRIGTLADNVDASRVKDNVIFVDRLKGRTIEEFIDKGMQKWIDEYNEGKKPSRQIKTTYTEWHKSQKRYQQGGSIEFAYEAVLSYGSKDDIGKLYEDPKTRKKIYEESKKQFEKWLKDIEEKYPHLKIIYAVAHYDEKTPHMHICYMPIASDYQRGLKRQVCISRALEQDGIEKIQDPKAALEAGGFQQARFYKKFRHEVMNPDLERLGYTVKKEETGKKHIDSRIYSQVMEEKEKILDEATTAAQQITEEAKKIQTLAEELKKTEEIERTPVYDSKKVKTIQYKESILSKPETLKAMPQENFDALLADAGARQLAFDTEEKIKRQNRVIEKFMENITQSDRELQLTKENERLKKQIEEKDLELSKITTKYEKLKTQITQFLEQFKGMNLFQKFKDYLRSWQPEWHAPEFTTPTQERKDRTR